MIIVGQNIRAHPRRSELIEEVHARPFEPMIAPEQGSHIAMIIDGTDEKTIFAHLSDLCHHHGVKAPEFGSKFYSVDLGPYRIRWEYHSEFCTYTFITNKNYENPFSNPVIDMVPEDWISELPGEIIAAVHFAIDPKEENARNQENLSALFNGNQIIGALVSGGAAMVWSDLRIHEDGFSRILIHDQNLSALQAGRLVQRILEINSYRLLALLSLPLAREEAPHIQQMEVALGEITKRLVNETSSTDAKGLLDELSKLASGLEEVGARTSYRFSATQAYFDIVNSRLEEIRQERIQGIQTFSEFLERRLVPAVNFCFSTEMRLESLAERMSRVGSLLRTRVEVQIEEQNRDLLTSMNRRAKMQFRLQRLVEGLSIVAVSYYLTGLIKYGLEAISAAGFAINVPIVSGISIPIVVIGVATVLYRARQNVENSND